LAKFRDQNEKKKSQAFGRDSLPFGRDAIKDFSTKTRELRSQARSQARSDAFERAAPRLKNAT
jgi:hypothetical protein